MRTQFFEDENLRQLFAQVTGYQILLDLLYENEKYDDVLKIYRDLNAKGQLYKNKYIDVIVLATYYRLVSECMLVVIEYQFKAFYVCATKYIEHTGGI